MKKVDVTMLRIAVKAVRSIECELRNKLTALRSGPYNPDGRGEATRAALSELADLGFSIRDDAYAFAIRLGGLRAESTSGVLGAMTNWLRAAETKIRGAA